LSAVVHQSGSSIITRAASQQYRRGLKVGSERCSGCIESHEDPLTIRSFFMLASGRWIRGGLCSQKEIAAAA